MKSRKKAVNFRKVLPDYDYTMASTMVEVTYHNTMNSLGVVKKTKKRKKKAKKK